MNRGRRSGQRVDDTTVVSSHVADYIVLTENAVDAFRSYSAIPKKNKLAQISGSFWITLNFNVSGAESLCGEGLKFSVIAIPHLLLCSIMLVAPPRGFGLACLNIDSQGG